MEFISLLLAIVIMLDLAALRWGYDSRDRFDSPEWDRLRNWRAFH